MHCQPPPPSPPRAHAHTRALRVLCRPIFNFNFGPAQLKAAEAKLDVLVCNAAVMLAYVILDFDISSDLVIFTSLPHTHPHTHTPLSSRFRVVGVLPREPRSSNPESGGM